MSPGIILALAYFLLSYLWQEIEAYYDRKSVDCDPTSAVFDQPKSVSITSNDTPTSELFYFDKYIPSTTLASQEYISSVTLASKEYMSSNTLVVQKYAASNARETLGYSTDISLAAQRYAAAISLTTQKFAASDNPEALKVASALPDVHSLPASTTQQSVTSTFGTNQKQPSNLRTSKTPIASTQNQHVPNTKNVYISDTLKVPSLWTTKNTVTVTLKSLASRNLKTTTVVVPCSDDSNAVISPKTAPELIQSATPVITASKPSSIPLSMALSSVKPFNGSKPSIVSLPAIILTPASILKSTLDYVFRIPVNISASARRYNNRRMTEAKTSKSSGAVSQSENVTKPTLISNQQYINNIPRYVKTFLGQPDLTTVDTLLSNKKYVDSLLKTSQSFLFKIESTTAATRLTNKQYIDNLPNPVQSFLSGRELTTAATLLINQQYTDSLPSFTQSENRIVDLFDFDTLSRPRFVSKSVPNSPCIKPFILRKRSDSVSQLVELDDSPPNDINEMMLSGSTLKKMTIMLFHPSQTPQTPNQYKEIQSTNLQKDSSLQQSFQNENQPWVQLTCKLSPSQKFQTRSTRVMRRCAQWPKCSDRSCRYSHPRKPCRNNYICRFGEQYSFLHYDAYIRHNIIRIPFYGLPKA